MKTSQQQPNKSVDGYLRKAKPWLDEFKQLREIVSYFSLTEEMKWGHPCYSFDGGKIVLMHGFKEYCALLFFKGALMKDPKVVLVQQTENVQSARQMRFTSLKEVQSLKATIKSYIKEAIELEKAGVKVPMKQTSDFKMPAEFQEKLDEMPELKTAFETLTPGRQRGYLLHFSSAKQSKTREARIEKCMPAIFDGKGLDDD